MADTFQGMWDLYAKSWSAVTPDERQSLLDRTVDPHCTYTDPTTDRHGVSDLAAFQEEFQKAMPGTSFRVVKLAVHHERGLVDWQMIDPVGAVSGSGTSFGRRNAAGRLVEIVGFFDPNDFR